MTADKAHELLLEVGRDVALQRVLDCVYVVDVRLQLPLVLLGELLEVVIVRHHRG